MSIGTSLFYKICWNESGQLLQVVLQIYSMSSKDIESTTPITQAEIYQDLSVALVHFREILRIFLTKPSLKIQLDQTIQAGGENASDLTFAIVHNKYKTMPQIRFQFEKQDLHTFSIMHRFIIRVKELLRHFVSTAPRYRVPSTLLIKNLEFELKQADESKNIKAAICTVLDFISTFTSKIKQHQSATSHPKLMRQDLQGSLEKRRTPEMSVNRPYWQLKTTQKESEAEQFMKNAMRYDCMGIDVQLLRAKYFNLKKNENQEYSECMTRNQFIRQLISSFEKSYEAFRQKIMGSRGNIKNKASKPVLEANQRQNHDSEPHKNAQNSTNSFKTCQNNFLKPSNENIAHDDHKTKTIEGSKVKSISFRDTYEQKMRQFRNVNMKNVVICQDFTPAGLHNVNAKKLQFFKRSKEQTKYRYKYYTYIRKDGNNSNQCIRAKNINPELMFTTLTYK